MNNVKTAFLLIGLTALLVSAGGALGGQTGLKVALVMALLMNVFSYWFSDRIVLGMYGARQVSEHDAPELYSIVRELASRAGLPMPKLYMMDAAQPNAFATGRNPEHAAVAVTSGIMQMLDREELRGVIAHELAHIRNRDILIGTVAAVIAGAISYLSHLAFFFGGSNSDEDRNPFVALLLMIVAPIAALIVQMAISRTREYAADRTGAEIAGTPHGLAGALRKLHYAASRVPMKAEPATSHMFIVSPLSGGGIMKLFSTHPPMEERIMRLTGRGI